MQIVEQLRTFWAKKGVKEIYSYDAPGAAATFHNQCFFGALDPEPIKAIMYTQPSWRYHDHNQGLSPIRFAKHHQFQVLIEYYPGVVQDYKDSLKFIGHKDTQILQFVENDWHHKSLLAHGIGWEILCDSLEITQFTFFEKMAGFQISHKPVEIAYGIERLTLVFQKIKASISKIHQREEQEISQLNKLDLFSKQHLKDCLQIIETLLDNQLPIEASTLR